MGAALIYNSPAPFAPEFPCFLPNRPGPSYSFCPPSGLQPWGSGTAKESWAVTSKDLEMPLSRGGPIQEAGDKSEGTGNMKDRKRG